MRISIGFASLLLALCGWTEFVQAEGAHELEVFSPMPPVRTASGVYAGKDLILGTEEDDPPESRRIRLMDESFGNSYGKPWVGKLFFWGRLAMWSATLTVSQLSSLRLKPRLRPYGST